MTIPPEISVLIDRLNQELDWAEQEATEGLNLARAALSRFPNNALLIQFFAYFNSVLLFVETYKRPTQNTVKRLTGRRRSLRCGQDKLHSPNTLLIILPLIGIESH
jgi:hypothetical protein